MFHFIYLYICKYIIYSLWISMCIIKLFVLKNKSNILYRISVKIWFVLKSHFRLRLIFLMYKKASFSAITYIFSSGTCFSNTDGPADWVNYHKNISSHTCLKIWKKICKYLVVVWNITLILYVQQNRLNIIAPLHRRKKIL